ncbi:MAG: hypothetical protein ACQESH_01280 [Campylobacterota bacterium]
MWFEIVIVVLLTLLLIIEFKRLQILKANKKQHKNEKNGQNEHATVATTIQTDCTGLKRHIEEEISKLRRYSSYTLTMMDFTLNLEPDLVAQKLQTFVRKSDRVFICNSKVYLFFPFTQDGPQIRQKIENRILTHLEGEFDKEVKFITMKFNGYKYDPELKDEEFPLIDAKNVTW